MIAVILSLAAAAAAAVRKRVTLVVSAELRYFINVTPEEGEVTSPDGWRPGEVAPLMMYYINTVAHFTRRNKTLSVSVPHRESP